MEPDPNAPPLYWSRNGIAFLWLIALILGLVLELELLARTRATAIQTSQVKSITQTVANYINSAGLGS